MLVSNKEGRKEGGRGKKKMNNACPQIGVNVEKMEWTGKNCLA